MKVLIMEDLGRSPEQTDEMLRAATGGRAQPVRYREDLSANERGEIRGLIVKKEFVPASLLSMFPNLELLAAAFTGVDGVDRAYCQAHGIAVYRVPDYSGESVAEFTLLLTLALLRKLKLADRIIREGVFTDRLRVNGLELRGRTVGIVGTGAIGVRVAALFRGFGCNVIGWARTPRKPFEEVGTYVRTADELFTAAHVVSLHVPSGPDTRRMVDARMLDLMRPDAVLINTARGDLIDTPALVNALRTHRILGAGLDVFAPEPPDITQDLFQLDNVLLTPHMAWKTEEATARLWQQTMDNVQRYLSGDRENIAS